MDDLSKAVVRTVAIVGFGFCLKLFVFHSISKYAQKQLDESERQRSSRV